MAIGGNPQIAVASIGLVPTITGVRGNIATQLAGSQVMKGADTAGKSIGSRLGSTITSTVKNTLKVGAVIGGAIAAMTLKGGIDRALNIEDARATMAGLGHDTQTVEKIMGNALASVEGTSFGLDAAATTAAGAVAAGIKPGEQLEGVLSTVANTAAAAGAGMDEIGGVFNTVAAVGAAYTGDINMLAQRGIPIWQSLSDTLGVSQDEVRKMATEGKIDFATFEAAAKDAAGGVATAMGGTTRGSIANMMTSFSKLGADLVTRFLPMIGTAATGVQSVVQAITAKLGPILDSVFGSFTPAATAGIEGFFENIVSWIEAFDPQPVIDFLGRVGEIGKGAFAELRDGITAFGAAWEYNDGEVTSSGLPGFMERAGYFARQLWDSIQDLDFSSFSAFTDSLGGLDMGGGSGALSGIGSSLAQIAAASPEMIASSLTILDGVLGFLADHTDVLVALIPVLAAGFAVFAISSKATTTALLAQRSAYIATLPLRVTSNALLVVANALELMNTRAKNRNVVATNMQTAATGRSTVAERIRNVQMRISNVLTRASAVATRLFGAALRFAMGPIGLIITGVTLLAAGLVYFFTQTETGSAIWSKVWGWIKNAAAAVVDWFTGTALPYLQAAWDGIAAGALWLYHNAILPAWNGIRTAIGVVADWITGTLWPAIQTAWSAIGTAAMWLYTNIIQPVWTGIRIAIAVAVTAVLVYIDLMKWYFSNVIAPVAIWLYESIIKPVWNGIKTAIGAVANWIVNTAWPLIKTAWDAIAGAATWLYESVILPVWNAIKSAIETVVNWVMNVGWPALKLTIDLIGNAMKWLYNNVILPVWNAIRTAISAVVQWFQNTAWPLISTVIGWLKLSFEGWKIIAQAVWNAIRTAVSTVATWFRDTAWPIVSGVIDRLKSGFNVMRDAIKSAWDFVKNRAIAPVANWLTGTLKPKIDKVTGNIKSAFDTMKEGIKRAWDAIKAAARTPIKFVIEDVYNDSLRSTFNGVANKLSLPSKWRLPPGKVGFADGGVMPGYTPGRDVHRFISPTGGVLDLSGGEPILRPEAGRVLGSGWVHSINRAARSGGVDGVKSFLGGGHQAFAGGGIWNNIKGLGGDTWDWITDKASTIAEAITDPFGVLTKLAGKAVDLIPGGGMFRAATVQVGKNAGEMLGDWLKGQLAPVMTDGSTTPVNTRGGGSLALAGQLARAHGLSFTSGYRPGARTRRTGSVSYHSLGRAHDYAAPMTADGKRRMMSYFNAMHPYKPTELLYSPAGARQWRRWGAMAQTSGSTYRGHFNHVHVAFKKGGMFGDQMGLAAGKPYLYDKGGDVPPGVRVIANRTNRPEKILPPRESKVITDLGKRGNSRDEGPVDISDDSIERLADILSSRPNVVQIGTRQAGHIAAAGAGAKRAMGGTW